MLISSPYLHAQHARFLSSFDPVNGNFRCCSWISKLLETIRSWKDWEKLEEKKGKKENTNKQVTQNASVKPPGVAGHSSWGS